MKELVIRNEAIILHGHGLYMQMVKKLNITEPHLPVPS